MSRAIILLKRLLAVICFTFVLFALFVAQTNGIGWFGLYSNIGRLKYGDVYYHKITVVNFTPYVADIEVFPTCDCAETS